MTPPTYTCRKHKKGAVRATATRQRAFWASVFFAYAIFFGGTSLVFSAGERVLSLTPVESVAVGVYRFFSGGVGMLSSLLTFPSPVPTVAEAPADDDVVAEANDITQPSLPPSPQTPTATIRTTSSAPIVPTQTSRRTSERLIETRYTPITITTSGMTPEEIRSLIDEKINALRQDIAKITSAPSSGGGSDANLSARIDALHQMLAWSLKIDTLGDVDITRASIEDLSVSGAFSSSSPLTLGGYLGLSRIIAPSETSDRLYNLGGTLYWAGNPVGGSAVGTWDTDGTDIWRASGEVGIGTINPTTALDVNGVITATGGNSTNWNTAYGWGNHASAGYLTSYAETDPVFGASSAFGITGTNVTNWNTAYGWGNHASAGYLVSASYTATDVLSKLLTVDGPTSTLDADTLDGHDATYFYPASNPSLYITDGNTNWDNIYGFIVDGNSGWDNIYGFITSSDDSVSGTELDGVFSTNGMLRRTASGTYSTITDNSTNWDTAYGWGNHASAGYLTSITGQSIRNLSDVSSLMMPTDGQVLTYDTTNGWQAEDAIGGMVIGGPVGSASAGSVFFAGASGVLAQDNGHLFWNDSNNRLGIGTVAPAATLHIASGGLVSGTTSTTDGALVHQFTGDESTSWLGLYSSWNNLYYGISAALPSPSGTSTIGGYYKGLGIGGSTSGVGNPIFGVLASGQSGNGIGAVALTVYDTNRIVTYSNTLDNGSGQAYFAGNVGIGTTTPVERLSVVGNMEIAGNIIPATTNTYALGSPTRVWKDLYVGPGSIYVNGQKVLQTDLSDSVVVSADTAQNLVLKTTGGGNVEVNPAVGGGQFLVKSNITLTGGKTFRTSDNSAVIFTDGLSANILAGTDALTLSSGGTDEDITLAPSGTGRVIAHGILGLDTSSHINFGTTYGATGYGFRDNGGTLEYKNASGSWVSLSGLSPAIGNIVNSAAQGSILFAGAGGVLAQDNANLFYDDTNNRLGIGTASPLAKLHLNGTLGALSGGLAFGDGDTGLYEASDDVLRLQTLGTDRVTVDANGNVGIGTTSPSQKLHVIGGGMLVESTPGNPWFSVLSGNVTFNSGGGRTTVGGADLSARFNISPINDSYPTLSIRGFVGGVQDIFRVSSSSATNGDYFIIKSDGNVGIGTTSPTSKLHLNGTLGALSGGLAFGDGDTGLYEASDDVLRLQTLGTDRVTVLGNGNVGIGTGNPLSKLHVYGPDGTEGTVQLGAYASVGAEYGSGAVILGANVKPKVGSVGMQYTATNAVGGGQAIYMKYTSGITFHTLAGSVVGGDTYSSERMRINTDGNVGIGTTSPLAKLDVNGSIQSSTAGIAISATVGWFGVSAAGRGLYSSAAGLLSLRADNASGYIDFRTGGDNSRMTITSIGNVGIGTTSPSQKLHVISTSAGAETFPLLIQNFDTTIGTKVGIAFSASTTSSRYSAIEGIQEDGLNRIGLGFLTGAGSSITEKMRINSYGDVGIGTTSPTSKLHLNGTLGALSGGLAFGDGDTGFYESSDDVLRLQTLGTDRVTVLENGNVGIGTTSPIASLHTSGGATGANFLGLFSEYGITPENSSAVPVTQNKTVSVQGAGAAYFMGRDVTNDIEFIMGTSASGAAFAGSMTAHDFWLRTNNTTRMTIQKDTGNVGIGTTSPGYALDIQTNASSDNNFLQILRNGVSSSSGFFKITNWTSTPGVMSPLFWSKGNNSGYSGLAFVGDIASGADSGTVPIVRFQARYNNGNVSTRPLFEFSNGNSDGTGSTVLEILANGNVGIGTTSPTSKLHLNGTLGALSGGLAFGDGDTGLYEASDDVLRLQTLGTDRVTVDANGNVGIGTTSPTKKLHIAGEIGTISGNIFLNNTAPKMYLSNNTIQIDAWTFESGATPTMGMYDGKVNITNSGNVGIGTTSPGYKLDVFGTASTDGARSTAGFDINPVIKPTFSAGNLALTAGGSNLGIGQYYYSVTYTTALGETNTSDGYAITTDASNRKVTITVPVSSDSRVTGRKIYRTAVGGAAFTRTLLTTIADNTTTTYVDDIADGSLGTTGDYFRSNTTSKYITVNGNQVMSFTPNSDGNLFFGYNTGNSTLSSGRNVGIGQSVLRLLTTGANNMALGNSALVATTTGSSNIGIGYSAGSRNTTGVGNTYIGHDAGFPNQTGVYNTALGSYALFGNAATVSHSYNTAIGSHSMYQITTGLRNTGIGYASLYENTTGANNVALGHQAGRYQADGTTALTDPENSVYIGYGARGYSNADDNSIVIGYNAIGLGANTVVLGNNSITTTRLQGNIGNVDSPSARLHIRGAGTTSSTLGLLVENSGGTPGFMVRDDGNVGVGTVSPDTFKLQIAGNVGPNADDTYDLGTAGSDWGCLYYNGGTLGTCASDERLKDNIEELSFGGDPLAIVEALSVRQFSFKNDETHSLYHGLIAQEVFDVAPALVVENPDGYLAVKYGDIQWVVVSAVQQVSHIMREQALAIADILGRLSGHDEEIERLRGEIEALRTQVNALGGQGGSETNVNGISGSVSNGETGESTLDEEVVEIGTEGDTTSTGYGMSGHADMTTDVDGANEVQTGEVLADTAINANMDDGDQPEEVNGVMEEVTGGEVVE